MGMARGENGNVREWLLGENGNVWEGLGARRAMSGLAIGENGNMWQWLGARMEMCENGNVREWLLTRMGMARGENGYCSETTLIERDKREAENSTQNNVVLLNVNKGGDI
ncbi:hypothetical protein CDAR_579081 [Caerostris darwini]|uniref:Uncharacterized protein n=1 Tax=Caerostris darwini TaxID=1538125 RepID=A0AAV4RQ84_9ARAC|nr:hypothetical protein CDAR_579081 [Caerostris darwini]